MARTTDSTGNISHGLDLTAMSREELENLMARVDRELDARAFEENLRREVESHMRKQDWVARTNPPASRRRRRY